MLHCAPYNPSSSLPEQRIYQHVLPHHWLTQLLSEGPVAARHGTCMQSGCFPSLKAFHCLSLEMLGQTRAALVTCTREMQHGESQGQNTL